MATGLNGLLLRARRAARKRNQRVSTAHVLLAMLQFHDAPGLLLVRAGVREGALLSALKVVDEEPISALEVAVERATKRAAADGADASSTHLLAAIAKDPRSAGYRCLDVVGAGADRVGDHAEAAVAPPLSRRPPSRGASARKQGAAAASSGPSSRGTVHIVPGGSGTRGGEGGPPAPASEPGHPEDRDDATQERKSKATKRRTATAEPRPNVKRGQPAVKEPAPARGRRSLDPEAYPTLAILGRNLSELAEGRALDPVVGRDRELEQLLDVLARRRANNPLLVGPPGVGKTALVEGLARSLAQGGDGVRGLEGRIVVEISSGALVSGTGVRGALAERMRKLREEVERSEGQILLFIDEIHAVVGGDGPDDLAQELKASLARGELSCIGATTDTEYRRCIERDAALARRFSLIRVAEPSHSVARQIVEGIAPRYEGHHHVVYDEAALEAAVSLTARYLPDRQLPDKAIGVLDQAGARCRRRGVATADVRAVAEVVAELADVPVDRLLANDGDRFMGLEARLSKRIVGHVAEIERVAEILRQGAAGLRGRQRPLGVFLLLGPTGVGKTELAKAVADEVFPPDALVRMDMNELSEAHSVARLLGSPPGYVGHEEGGQLTEAVRRRPYRLILLDEIEKAHPDVLLTLLPLLDEGRLTDARGRTVDFTNTVLFLTSNLGAAEGAQGATTPIGFGRSGGEQKSRAGAALAAARAALPPEVWNRIDEPLFFQPLLREEALEIARRMVSELQRRLCAERGVVLSVDADALEVLLEQGGFEPSLGARPLRRTLSRLIEGPVAKWLLAGEVERGDEIAVRGAGGQIQLARGVASAAE